MISIKEGIKDFKDYYNKIKDGYNPGILTPYDNINRALFNGIPKNTVSCISGHSGKNIKNCCIFALKIFLCRIYH